MYSIQFLSRAHYAQELPAVRYTMINETCTVPALSEPKFQCKRVEQQMSKQIHKGTTDCVVLETNTQSVLVKNKRMRGAPEYIKKIVILSDLKK